MIPRAVTLTVNAYLSAFEHGILSSTRDLRQADKYYVPIRLYPVVSESSSHSFEP